jgi:hypothetical protein
VTPTPAEKNVLTVLESCFKIVIRGSERGFRNLSGIQGRVAKVGIRRGELRRGPQTALLRFARTVVTKQGIVDDADVEAVKAAGYGDAEIAEAVAHVALNVFTNYFNNVAGTAIDFPRAPALSV